VSDNGPGIPVEDRSKATERFYRGDSSRGTPGVGLGLSLVAAVAKLHGGSLELTDNYPGLRATLIVQHDAMLSGLQARAPEALSGPPRSHEVTDVVEWAALPERQEFRSN